MTCVIARGESNQVCARAFAFAFIVPFLRGRSSRPCACLDSEAMTVSENTVF
ncbi:hypothetical protein PAXRUDRAFT_822169 [Paxillus rubicundulus Ve08.2h10]|uniref:Uncharacterized protein n=1 Tax=Paxillus rubicundulus Ve08.2h10 TaxID=930991 RepID=A0A0D0ECU6_9AGAM|nr:hypothetical protein PAXRUDRAFT_822169 [Paxillus rubicundulus Ve08.2h10]